MCSNDKSLNEVNDDDDFKKRKQNEKKLMRKNIFIMKNLLL